MAKKVSESELRYRLNHVEQWHSQKISMRQYALSNNLNYNLFKNWCYKWKIENGLPITPMKGSGKFVPLSVTPSQKEKKENEKVSIPQRLPRFELKLLYGLLHFRIG